LTNSFAINQTPAHFSHSSNFADVLSQFGCSLLASTYQAGRLCAFGTHEGKLHVELQPYPLAIAIGTRRVAVGTRGTISGGVANSSSKLLGRSTTLLVTTISPSSQNAN
jgi:hypothetical protein